MGGNDWRDWDSEGRKQEIKRLNWIQNIWSTNWELKISESSQLRTYQTHSSTNSINLSLKTVYKGTYRQKCCSGKGNRTL